MSIRYKRFPKRWKYQLQGKVVTRTAIRPERLIEVAPPTLNCQHPHVFIRLTRTGELTVFPGYAWDGASGPAIDTRSIMKGSLLHDALYQLMRTGRLPLKWREVADNLFRQTNLLEGMHPARAWWTWKAVRLFGERYARPEDV